MAFGSAILCNDGPKRRPSSRTSSPVPSDQEIGHRTMQDYDDNIEDNTLDQTCESCFKYINIAMQACARGCLKYYRSLRGDFSDSKKDS